LTIWFFHIAESVGTKWKVKFDNLDSTNQLPPNRGAFGSNTRTVFEGSCKMTNNERALMKAQDRIVSFLIAHLDVDAGFKKELVKATTERNDELGLKEEVCKDCGKVGFHNNRGVCSKCFMDNDYCAL
jgi:ribosomal protein S27AE